mgnify:FL=1
MKKIKKYLLMLMLPIFILVGCKDSDSDQTELDYSFPIVEIKNENKIEISKIVFEEYLKSTYENYEDYKSTENKKINILKDYKFNDIKIIKELNDKAFEVEISFDLQSIDGYATVFETGNGVISKDNWVKDKYLILDIEEVGANKYTIKNMYTG